jgi:hypothetical protein
MHREWISQWPVCHSRGTPPRVTMVIDPQTAGEFNGAEPTERNQAQQRRDPDHFRRSLYSYRDVQHRQWICPTCLFTTAERDTALPLGPMSRRLIR